MKCLECGKEQTTRVGTHRYGEADGVDVAPETVSRCLG